MLMAYRGYSEESPFVQRSRRGGFAQARDVASIERRRLVIADTAGSRDLDKEDLAALSAEGIRAMNATPMKNRNGETVGVLGVQYREPHQPEDHELRLLDLIAWTGGNFIARHRAETALRQATERYRSLFLTMDEGFAVVELLPAEQGAEPDLRFLAAWRC